MDELHRQTVSYLVRHYKVVFTPTFETSSMVLRAKRRINTKSVRATLTWSHYRFKQLLIARAKRSGVLVVETNEAYTSKTCGKCGYVHARLHGNKIFKCRECGYIADRDANGAFGIMLKALVGTPFTLAGDAIKVFSGFGEIQNL